MYTSRKPEVIGNALEELEAIGKLGVQAFDLSSHSISSRNKAKLNRLQKFEVLEAYKSIEAKILGVKIGKVAGVLFETVTVLPHELSREHTGYWHNDVYDKKHIRNRKMVLATSNVTLGTEFVYGTYENEPTKEFDKSQMVEEGLANGQFSYWKEYEAGDLVYAPATTLHRSPVNTTDEVQSRTFHRTWLDV